MDDFKIIAFTHRRITTELLGKLHLSSEDQVNVLGALKLTFGFDELIYLGTCNRIELLIRTHRDVDVLLAREISLFLNSRLNNVESVKLSEDAEIYTGNDAVIHLLRVASSLESLVVGEREIITQVRRAYEFCNQLGLTGDFMRILVKHTVETAKNIYTHTGISRNPVSVASLAYRQLRALGLRDNARIVFVGAGETNRLLASYFKKHRFANFVVFNRTLGRAEALASQLNGTAKPLDQLVTYNGGFDVLVVCTSSATPLITPANFLSLRANEAGKKTIIDLGMPANVSREVSADPAVNYIDIISLKEQADRNLELRKGEMEKCEVIIAASAEQFNALYDERKIERAFGEIPRKVRSIMETAMNDVFAREIARMGAEERALVEKVLGYVEKKYNAIAIKTAKEAILSLRHQEQNTAEEAF